MTSRNTRRINDATPERPELGAGPDNSPTALRGKAAAAISRALISGDLRHPDAPNGALIIPGFNPAGHQNPEVADAIGQLGNLVGEALVATVLAELGAELVTTADLRALTTVAVNQPARTVTLNCRHGELLRIAVKPGTNHADVNCNRLRANLTECKPKPAGAQT